MPAYDLRSARRFSRRSLLAGASAVTTAAALAAAGCSSKGNQPSTSSSGAAKAGGTPQPGGTYQFSMSANPPILDPQRSSTSLTMNVAGAVYSLLFHYQLSRDPNIAANHVIENGLAVSSESPDALTWTIKLRPNVKFQNIPPVSGRTFTAEDVKDSFTRALSLPDNPSKGPLDMIDPAQIQTPDSSTVVFKIRYPYAMFLNTLSAPVYSWILPREATTGGYDPSKTLIGTGPFLFETYTPDVGVTLKKNPDWYVTGQPYVDGVNIAVIPDQLTAESQFRAGHIDQVAVTFNDQPAMKQGVPQAQILKSPGNGINTYYFQLGDPASPFRDIRLRQAVSMAIDRDSLGKAIFGDYSKMFAVPGYFGNWALNIDQLDDSTKKFYTYDPAGAKQLFDQAGGGSLSIRLVYVAPGELEVAQKPITEGIYKMLQAFPWQISLGTIDFNTQYVNGGKGYDYGHIPVDWLLDGGQSSLPDPDAYIYDYFYSKSPRNEDNMADPTLDGMIDKARMIADANQRRLAYIDIQKYIAGQLYSIAGMPSQYNYTFVQPRVQNFGFSYENGNYALNWAQLWLSK
jgi:peptide/nickel transport system substrate-binding protein